MSQDRLSSLISHYKDHGISPRQLGSGGRQNNTKALSFQDITQVVQYISGYSDDHALALPGRVPGIWRKGVNLLPSACTKISVYDSYKKATTESGTIH